MVELVETQAAHRWLSLSKPLGRISTSSINGWRSFGPLDRRRPSQLGQLTGDVLELPDHTDAAGLEIRGVDGEEVAGFDRFGAGQGLADLSDRRLRLAVGDVHDQDVGPAAQGVLAADLGPALLEVVELVDLAECLDDGGRGVAAVGLPL